MMKTGAEVLIECLKREGVDVVFGYPGGQVLPLYDKLYDSDLKHILVRHEQGAAHAADGYARATGKVGVCIATSGPGATNLVTGIANAYMDSVPLVAITGQVKSPLVGKDSFQEVDIIGITLSIVKHSYAVKTADEIAGIVREAFYIAKTGRPGPVIIDIPSDIMLNKVEQFMDCDVKIDNYSFECEKINGNVDALIEAIKKSKKPLIYAGGGIVSAEAQKELKTFAEMLNIPVVTTLMGIGAFPYDNPLNLGMLGMHGTRYANHGVCNCDLLIGIGVRFDDRATGDPAKFAQNAEKVQIDIDDAEINKIVPVDIGIVGDAKKILKELIKRFENYQVSDEIKLWLSEIDKVKTDHPLRYDNDGTLKPQYVIEKIYEVTGGKAIVTTDVGEHQMWSAQYNKATEKRSFITSGGLGTMGFGFPAAIGAQTAFPDRVVISISGDGSFQMNSQELMTAVTNNLPVIVAIINNGHLGMVRQWQQLFYNERYSYTNIEQQPDFVKLAEAYGALGIRVTKPEEVEDALKKAIAMKKTAVIDFCVNREENVYPMVPAGSSLSNIIG